MIDILKKQKFAISFLLIIMIFISLGVFTIKGLYTLDNLTAKIYEHPLVVSNASLHAALEITKMHRNMKDVVLADSLNEIEVTLEAVKEDEQKVYQQLDIIRKDILGDEGKILEQQTRQLFVKWKPIREEVVQLLKSGNRKEAIFITLSGVILSLIIAFIAIRLVLKSEKLLRDQNSKLQASLEEIQILRGILPICSFCKNIR
jgi:hypothetical protein